MKIALKTLAALLCIALLVCGVYTCYTEVRKKVYTVRYDGIISEYCVKYSLDKALVCALIKCESGFDSTAVSSVGARGLTQLTEDTFDWVKGKLGDEAAEITWDDMFTPEVAVNFGCKLLTILINEFENYPSSLAAYHAGSSCVRKWLKDTRYSSDGENLDDIPYDDTRQYVERVMSAYKVYGEMYSDEL